MRFAIVTDVHFGPDVRYDGKLRKLSHQAESLLRDTLQELESVYSPQLLVNLGDVIEDESAEADEARYRQFLHVLEGSKAPKIHVAGNHDLVNLTPATLTRLWQRDGELHYGYEVATAHFIVLQTDMGSYVHLSEVQLQFLERELARAQKPVIVLVHHPLGEQDVSDSRWFFREPQLCHVVERRRARDLIHESGKVLAVFNGHVHWNHLYVDRGIPYVTVQSLIENLDADAPGRAARAFAVVDIKGNHVHVRVGGSEPLRYEFDVPLPWFAR